MGLRDKYQTPPVGTAPSPEPVAIVVDASTAEAAATVATAQAGIADPASELAALRAKLAGRGNVNPPEAMIPDDAMTRTTRETKDGGAELLTQPESPPSLSSSPAPTESASTESPSNSETGPSRKPRQKKPPAAAEAPSAAGVEALLERIANALELIGDNLRLRIP